MRRFLSIPCSGSLRVSFLSKREPSYLISMNLLEPQYSISAPFICQGQERFNPPHFSPSCLVCDYLEERALSEQQASPVKRLPRRRVSFGGFASEAVRPLPETCSRLFDLGNLTILRASGV
jgi:hypothetical protein